jgi:hypothetical protein
MAAYFILCDNLHQNNPGMLLYKSMLTSPINLDVQNLNLKNP